MEYIRVTKDNLEKEHICCAISNNKDVQVSSKKAWLADRFDEGLVFLKSVERGKCFIEYIPAENAWVPINADGYMYIDCLWVSGSFKGHGYSTELLDVVFESDQMTMPCWCLDILIMRQGSVLNCCAPPVFMMTGMFPWNRSIKQTLLSSAMDLFRVILSPSGTMTSYFHMRTGQK